MSADSASRTLERGLERLDLALSEAQRAQLLAYLDLLAQWNRRFNLTAVRDRNAMVTRHLLDSLSIRPFIRGQRLIDVGSGAGLPGMALAIADPGREYTLLDSRGKKTRFLVQAKSVLGLERLQVVQARVENYRCDAGFDQVLSRAFAPLDAMITGCHHLLASAGEFVAMKGAHPEDELRRLPAGYEVRAVETLAVPGLFEERCVLRIGRRREPSRVCPAPGSGSGAVDHRWQDRKSTV